MSDDRKQFAVGERVEVTIAVNEWVPATYIRRSDAGSGSHAVMLDGAGSPGSRRRDLPSRRVRRPFAAPWTCHAHPVVLDGKECGHVNEAVVMFRGLPCCGSCGCTKTASDDRARRKEDGTAELLEKRRREAAR